METQLFLVAFIGYCTVAVGLTYVQPDNIESADQTVKENFHNFFDSIKRDDIKKTESYRKFLKQEAVREQKAFDTMKEDLRPRHVYLKSGGVSKKVVQFKRAAEEAKEAEHEITEVTGVTGNQEEDDFISTYENKNGTSGFWPEGRAIASDEEKLKQLCKQAHQKFGLGYEDVVNRVKFDSDKVLSFDTFNDTVDRVPISLDVISYGVTRLPESLWYITKGTKSYCVFYLMMQPTTKRQFRLGREVCGIHMPTPKVCP